MLFYFYIVSGHLIASLLAGQCVMMVIFSNQLVIWQRYLQILSSYQFSHFSFELCCLIDFFHFREERVIKENLKAQENPILLKLEPFGTFLEVLIDCGRFIYLLYRYSVAPMWYFRCYISS